MLIPSVKACHPTATGYGQETPLMAGLTARSNLTFIFIKSYRKPGG